MAINWDWESSFVFLCELNESGIVNMWGAAPYLGCKTGRNNEPTEEAVEILIHWMQNFAEIEAHLKNKGLI